LKKSESFQKSVRSESRNGKIRETKLKNCYVVSDETRDKISQSLKGKFIGEENPFFGKTHSSETKELMSQKASERIGEKNSFYNKSHSEETKNKIRFKLESKPKKEYYVYDSEMNLIIKDTSKNLLSFFDTTSPNEISRHCDKAKKYKGYYVKSN